MTQKRKTSGEGGCMLMMAVTIMIIAITIIIIAVTKS